MTTTAVDIDAIVSRAESLCRQVAPLDLVDTPLYIVPQSRLPDELGGKSVADGYTTPTLDLYLRDVIGPAWRGRGACMVVNDDFSEAAHADDVESGVAAVVLHELSHVLTRPTIFRDRPAVDTKRLKFEALCVGDMVSREKPTREGVPPFAGHEHRFIRIALHLRHRAEALGVAVPLYAYCAGKLSGLSHPNRYRAALGDEPIRLAHLSIRAILNLPRPSAFWRLWFDDVSHWLSSDSFFTKE